jgi:hypothetical protein
MSVAGVPGSSQTFRTKQELALDLIERALQNGVQFSWVGFDGFYGDNGQLLRMLDGAAALDKLYLRRFGCRVTIRSHSCACSSPRW